MYRILIIFIAAFVPMMAFADWVLDSELSRNQNKELGAISISSSPDYIYVAWEEDDELEIQNIYVSRFSRSGSLETLGDALGTTYTSFSFSPTLVYHNSKLYLSFSEFDMGKSNLRLLDWTGVWDTSFPKLEIQNSGSYREYSSILDNQPIVLFDAGELKLFRFTGVAWEQIGSQINEAGTTVFGYDLASSNQIPYVLYHTDSYKLHAEYYIDDEWEPLGNTINTEASLGTYTSRVKIQIDNNTPYVFYFQYQTGGHSYHSVLKKYDGNQWQTICIEQMDEGSYSFPDYKIFNHNHYIVYRDNSSNYLLVFKYNGSGWQQLGDPLNIHIPPIPNRVSDPQLAMMDNSLYAAWRESDGQEDKLYLAHYEAPAPTATPTPISTPYGQPDPSGSSGDVKFLVEIF